MSVNIEPLKDEWKEVIKLLKGKYSSINGLFHIGEFDIEISDDGNMVKFWPAGQKDCQRSEVLVNPMSGGINFAVYNLEEVEQVYDLWGKLEIQEERRCDDSSVYPKIRLRWNGAGMLTRIMIDVSDYRLVTYNYNRGKGIYELNKKRTREWELPFLNLPECIRVNEMVLGKHILYNANFPRKIKKIVNDSRIKELRRALEVEN